MMDIDKLFPLAWLLLLIFGITLLIQMAVLSPFEVVLLTTIQVGFGGVISGLIYIGEKTK